MSTHTEEHVEGEVVPFTSRQRRTRPWNSLVAAARRVTERTMKRRGQKSADTAAASDAWDMYDLVGELRFLANTIAGRVAAAHLFVARYPGDPTEDPVPIERLDPEAELPEGTEPPPPLSAADEAALAAWEALGTPVARSQMIGRLAIGLFVPGDGYVAGIPRWLLPSERNQPGLGNPDQITPEGMRDPGDDIRLDDLTWFALSSREVTETEDEVTLTVDGGQVKAKPSEVYLIRVWRQHPAHAEVPDSPTRSALPVLRELVGLTMHKAAQIDSRLAGAGLFLVAQEIVNAINAEQDPDGTVEDEDNPVIEALLEAAMTAIQDRSSAAALVPVVLTVPGAWVEKGTKLITFSTPFDSESDTLTTSAITRLAVQLDAPPELLTGVGGMNHWGAWLVKEDTVESHVKPPLAILADAFTTQYLHPVMLQAGVPEEEVKRYLIWRDTDHLIQRPDKSDNAKAAHAAGALSDDALRDAMGFDDTDAPHGDPAILMAMQLVTASPALMANPGLPAVVAQCRAILEGDEDTSAPAIDGDGDSGGGEGPPAAEGDMPALAASPSAVWPAADPYAFARAPQPLAINVNVEPADLYATLDIPEGAFALTMDSPAPNVTVNVPEAPAPVVNVDPRIEVTVPEQAPPVVNVAAPPPAEVTVNVPEQAAPVVNVPPAEVTVNVPEQPAPNITVEPPNVEVPVTVQSPDVTVNVPPAEVTVNTPEPKRRRVHTDIIRDADGNISSVESEDWA